jgi:hypothetical protein
MNGGGGLWKSGIYKSCSAKDDHFRVGMLVIEGTTKIYKQNLKFYNVT